MSFIFYRIQLPTLNYAFFRQTLTLQEVRKSSPVPETKSALKVVPWTYSVVSPFQRAADSPNWVQFTNEVNILSHFYKILITTF